MDHSFLQVRTEDYADTGIPFVRVSDLGDMLLRTDRLTYITEEAHKKEADTIFHPGDLLASKTGRVAVSIVPQAISECNTSQDVMGIVVKPKIYFGLGVSGAIQHKIGMENSQTIVSINRDPSAAMHGFADHAVVGEIRQALPRLVEVMTAAG